MDRYCTRTCTNQLWFQPEDLEDTKMDSSSKTCVQTLKKNGEQAERYFHGNIVALLYGGNNEEVFIEHARRPCTISLSLRTVKSMCPKGLSYIGHVLQRGHAHLN